MPNFQPSSAVNFTGNINNVSAVDVIDTYNNFNSNNDSNNSSPTSPTVYPGGGGVDHTINTDGSANISFEWQYSPSTNPISANNIDGFIVYVKIADNNNIYSFGTSPESETTYTVDSSKREVILSGVPANKYYHFGVRAYRSVYSNVNSNGVLLSNIVKTRGAGESPAYLPSGTVAFGGNITGTINDISAVDVGVGTTTGTGSNLISNSDYTSSMTAVNGYNPNSANITEGITYASVNSPSWTTNSYILKSGSTQNLYVKQESPVSGGDNAIGIDIYPCSINSTAVKIPVVAGETYCFSAYTQAHRAKTAVGIVFYNASDTGLSYPESSLV